MGKGDRKTAKGKRYNSSYGNLRKHATRKATGTGFAPAAKKATTRTTTATRTTATTKTVSKSPTKKAVAKKAVAKKAVAKKAAAKE